MYSFRQTPAKRRQARAPKGSRSLREPLSEAFPPLQYRLHLRKARHISQSRTAAGTPASIWRCALHPAAIFEQKYGSASVRKTPRTGKCMYGNDVSIQHSRFLSAVIPYLFHMHRIQRHWLSSAGFPVRKLYTCAVSQHGTFRNQIPRFLCIPLRFSAPSERRRTAKARMASV